MASERRQFVEWVGVDGELVRRYISDPWRRNDVLTEDREV